MTNTPAVTDMLWQQQQEAIEVVEGQRRLDRRRDFALMLLLIVLTVAVAAFFADMGKRWSIKPVIRHLHSARRS